MIYKKGTYCLLFIPTSGPKLLKPLKFSVKRDVKVSLAMSVRWRLDLHLRMVLLVAGRSNHFQPQPPDHGGRESGWRLNQSVLANDLIQRAYVMKPPKNPERMRFGELPGLVNTWRYRETV